MFYATLRDLSKHRPRNLDKLRDRAGSGMGSFPVKPGQGQITSVRVISFVFGHPRRSVAGSYLHAERLLLTPTLLTVHDDLLTLALSETMSLTG